jgi:hypothetical protein
MAEDPCAPYAPCENLDGRLLINRTADGPAIAVELGELPFRAGGQLGKSIAATILDANWRGIWTTTRNVHLFMGTHVEAVAGNCVLPHVPPA